MADTKATVQVVMVDMTAMITMEELVAAAKWGEGEGGSGGRATLAVLVVSAALVVERLR
jgi:hypothetical protein